jgi:LPS-assembly protein
MQYTAQASNGLSLRAVGGESIQLSGKNPYALYYGSGLETARSDYVSGLYIDYKNLFRLTAQVRFDESTLTPDYQSYSFQAKLGWLQGGVGYENVAPSVYYATAREEISGFGAVKLNGEWTVFGDARYDIELGEFIRYSGGVQYADECYIVSLTYARTNITIGDITPSTSVLLRIGIKGFGQQTAPSSLYDLSPEAQAANFR